MNSKDSDSRDLPENGAAGDEPEKIKKKKAEKNREAGEDAGEAPEEEIDFETGLPPMKW